MTQKLPSISPTIRRHARLLSTIGLLTGLTLVASPAFASGNLVLIPDPIQLAVLVAVFVLLIFPVNSLIFKPIMKALEEREARIAGARERSEHLQREASSVLARYEEAIRQARADAERSRKSQLDGAKTEQVEITSAARAEAERQLEGARGELRASLESARTSLRAQSQDLAREAAARVLGRAL